MNLQQIEKEITTVQARLELLQTAHKALTQLSGGTPAKAKTASGANGAPAVKRTRKPRAAAATAGAGAEGATTDNKPTYIEAMIPALEEIDAPNFASTLHADALLKRLQKHYPNVKRSALDAAMAAEVKKPNARIVRAGKGQYSLSPSYRKALYARESATVVPNEPGQPQASEQAQNQPAEAVNV